MHIRIKYVSSTFEACVLPVQHKNYYSGSFCYYVVDSKHANRSTEKVKLGIFWTSECVDARAANNCGLTSGLWSKQFANSKYNYIYYGHI